MPQGLAWPEELSKLIKHHPPHRVSNPRPSGLPRNVTVVCGSVCLACHDEFFVTSPLDVKGDDEDALDGTLHLSLLFRSSSYARVLLVLSSPKACLISARVCRTTLDAVSLSDPSQNRIRPDTRLQIKGRKNQHVHSAA
jgi:hypothetical protein